ncbi:MAG: excisionase [Deltaproteobacteria bacterium]|nr:MAG: excisionase [Deltaproteobacteria bacterium]
MPVFFQKTPRPHKWVRLNRYCELTGDTAAAVHARRKKGVWLDGRHTILAPDGKLWVNTQETEKWVEHGNKVSQ